MLSEFAGAAQSLGAGAILVNPWNITDMAAAIEDALTMSDQASYPGLCAHCSRPIHQQSYCRCPCAVTASACSERYRAVWSARLRSCMTHANSAHSTSAGMGVQERRERHRQNYMHVTIHTSQTWADTFISELNDTHVEAELRTKHIPPQVGVPVVLAPCVIATIPLDLLGYQHAFTCNTLVLLLHVCLFFPYAREVMAAAFHKGQACRGRDCIVCGTEECLEGRPQCQSGILRLSSMRAAGRKAGIEALQPVQEAAASARLQRHPDNSGGGAPAAQAPL